MDNYGRLSNEVEKDRSSLSGMPPVQSVGHVTGPYPPGTLPPPIPLGGIIFPSNHADYL